MKKTTIAYTSTSVLLGLLAVLVIPSGSAESPTGLALHGMGTITQYDQTGNVLFEQTVHNILFDAGEDFILDQAFTGLGSDVADATQIGAICLSADATPSSTETDTASTFNTDNVRTGTLAKNCKTDAAVGSAGQIATVGPLTFTAGADGTGVNWVGGDTITNIGVCRADTADADVRDCATTLFAVVNTSDVTLANAETVDVTYNFNLASAGS